MLREVAAALDDPTCSGAAIFGADGAGKTLLAHSAAEASSAVVHRVVGTATEQAIPFGAFRALLTGADLTATGRPAELLRTAQEYLTGDDARQLFVVDDAHHLDHLSATLLYQLALRGSARLIVTVRSGADLPEAVAALWADGLLTRVEVGSLDAATTAALLESALGSAPDAAVVDRVVTRSQGNPLHLRHLVEGGDLTSGATLPGLIDGYLTGLPSPARTVLDYLAMAEPLGRSDLAALAGEDAVEQAEAAGVLAVDDDSVYPAHPLYAARAAAALAPDAARALRLSLVEHLAARPSTHVGDQLRLAALAVDSDSPDAVGDLVSAAQHALRFGELELAEQLAHAALDRSGGLPARLALGYALAWQGRGREADAVLAAVDPDQLSQPELMEWAMPRAANQFWMLSEPERATAFLQTIRNRISALDGSGHSRRAGRDLRDERGHTVAFVADRRRGAGIAARRRGRGGMGGFGCGAEFGPRRTVRRRRSAGPAGHGRRPSGPAAVHQRLRPDHRVGDGRPADRGPRACPALHRLRRTAAAGPGDRRDVGGLRGDRPGRFRRRRDAAEPGRRRRWRGPAIRGVRCR